MTDKKFNELLWEFHRDLKQLNHFTRETVKTYISCIQKYERFANEKLQIDLLQTTEENLFEFILDLKKKLSPSRITHYRAALRRFFKMLFWYDEIEKNPAKNLLPIRRKKPTRYKYIPQEIIFKMLNTIDDDVNEHRNGTKERDKLMLLLLWCLGLRSLEVRSIKKEDIKIIDEGKKSALITVHGKGAKERALLVMDKLFDLLTDYIKGVKENSLLFPGQNNNIKVPECNRRMDDSSINKRIKKYSGLAGINTHITAHCLRHSFATEMYYANVPLEAIKTMLGHDNLRETSAYIHVSDRDIKESLNCLKIGV
jgi:integrase/recombinase XerD